MTRLLFITLVAVLSSGHAFAQQNPSPAQCLATEQAVRDVSHEIWAAYRNRDVSTYDKLVDDSYISTDDGGVRKRKPDVLAELRKPEGNIHTETNEQPEEFGVVFTGGVAIVSQTKHWTDYDNTSGISWGATSRTTRVLTCTNGTWKLVAFHETDIPNRNRQPSPNDHLDDYVGHYRLVDSRDKGEITVVRKGDKLSEFSESWGEEAVELLPGKYDTFFSRDDGWVERFVRDRSGKVTGILYTLVDGEIEAKRVP
jgi:ketosteroid isomerase-like protein